MAKLFISYRRDDSGWEADTIREKLDAHFRANGIGIEVLLDVDSIPVGVDFRRFIENSIDECEYLLAVIGKEWLNVANSQSGMRRLDDSDDYVRLEIEAGLRKIEIGSDPHFRIIPVLLGDAQMPRPDELPGILPRLVRLNAARIGFPPRRQSDLEKLARTIEDLEKARLDENLRKRLIADAMEKSRIVAEQQEMERRALEKQLHEENEAAEKHRRDQEKEVEQLVMERRALEEQLREQNEAAEEYRRDQEIAEEESRVNYARGLAIQAQRDFEVREAEKRAESARLQRAADEQAARLTKTPAQLRQDVIEHPEDITLRRYYLSVRTVELSKEDERWAYWRYLRALKWCWRIHLWPVIIFPIIVAILSCLALEFDLAYLTLARNLLFAALGFSLVMAAGNVRLLIDVARGSPWNDDCPWPELGPLPREAYRLTFQDAKKEFLHGGLG